MSGRLIREKVVSAAKIKVLNEPLEHMRHSFEDDFAHLAWGGGLGAGKHLDGGSAPVHPDRSECSCRSKGIVRLALQGLVSKLRAVGVARGGGDQR